MSTGISGLYKNTKGAKAAERERLNELFKKTRYKVFPDGATDYNLADQFTEFALNDIVDKFLANGVRVEIPNNSVSLINGHIDGKARRET